ncbi:MAG: non-homologous end-joining DNA ligase [Gemmatimonadota bacterium]
MSPKPLEEGMHRATRQGKAEKAEKAPAKVPAITIPADHKNAEIVAGDKTVALTNLSKVFFPEEGYTKRHLLQYYADIAPALLPHLRDRAMVMKRYPNGIHEKFFFMKRAPAPRPAWIQTCTIEHSSGNVIDFPMIQDLAALLWVINLGCVDLNQWYARCDDVDRPDYLHFDLDPGPKAGFAQVLETAGVVHEALTLLKMPHYAKTTGSRGIHVYAPIVRGPTQKQVWSFAKAVAHTLASQYPKLITSVYALAKRPEDKVLVDYNQNAWGRTLASIYSVRAVPSALVSTPVTWEEIDAGIRLEDFRMRNVPARVKRLGDLWKPLLQERGRFPLEKVL